MHPTLLGTADGANSIPGLDGDLLHIMNPAEYISYIYLMMEVFVDPASYALNFYE
jgi:hypothetical protein